MFDGMQVSTMILRIAIYMEIMHYYLFISIHFDQSCGSIELSQLLCVRYQALNNLLKSVFVA